MPESPLFLALKKRDWEKFQALLSEGADFLEKDAQGGGLMFHLVNVFISPALLVDFLSTQPPAKRATLVSQKNEKGASLLHQAAEVGNVALIPWLIAQGLEVNAQDNYGYTALHKASTSIHFKETIACLLKNKASVHICNINGDNPIQYALGLGLIEDALCMTHHLFEQLALPSLSEPSLLGLFESFYNIFSREKKEETQDVLDFRQQQLEHMGRQLSGKLQSTSLKDSILPLLLFLGSEIALAQNQYTIAMFYAASGLIHSKDITQSLLTAQRQRILIRFRKTTGELSDGLPVYKLSQPFCHMSAHTPITLTHLIESIQIHRHQLKGLLLSNDNSIQNLLEINSTFFQKLTMILFEMAVCLADSNQSLPQYALLTLGSMSQNEMCPYSDLEFALLISDVRHRKRFERVIDFMELLVMALGETPMEKLSLNPTGYRFDITPKNDNLLLTPQEMAHQATTDEQSLILRQALRGANFVQGDVTLFQAYQRALQKSLKSMAKPEALALFKDALLEFSPSQFGSKKERRKKTQFEVKTELYRLPSQMLLGLCLYQGFPPVVGSLARVKQLEAKGYLSKNNANLLIELLNAALSLRFQVHLHYGTEREAVYHPDRQGEVVEKNAYWLDSDFVERQLPSLYLTLFGIELGLERFLEGGTGFFYKSSLVPSQTTLHPFLQARIHERMLLSNKALGSYQAALGAAPKDWGLHAAYQRFIIQLQDKLEQEREEVIQQGQDLTEQLMRLFQASNLPTSDYASRYHSLPDIWKGAFLKGLETHSDKEEIRDHLDMVQAKRVMNWSKTIDSDQALAYEQIERYREEQITGFIQAYTQRLQKTHISHQQAAIILAFLPLLAKKIEFLDKKIEEQSSLNHQAIEGCVKMLLEHENDKALYLKIYRQTRPSLRPLFHEAIVKHGQRRNPKFIEGLLKAFNQEPDDSGQRQSFKQQKTSWQALLEALVTKTPGTDKTCNLVSPLLSQRLVLKAAIREAILDKDGEFKRASFDGVEHKVLRLSVTLADGQVRNLYLKAYPEMPGMSYLIEQLHHHIVGHGTSLSELIKLERPGKPAIPILISEEIPGPTLHKALTETPELIESINRRAFTELVWMAILTNPEDGLPTNYILHAPAGEPPTLISIDHDHALFPAFALERSIPRPELDGKKSEDEAAQSGLQMQLQVKTILFCLDLMKEQMDSEARLAFLRLKPEAILKAVLRQAQKQNAWYAKLFSEDDIKGFHQAQDKSIFRLFQANREQCTIPIPLKAGDTIEIYQKFVKLQAFIGKHPEASLLQCLTFCQPRVGLLYTKAFEEYEQPLDRLLNLGRYPMNRHGQMVTRSKAFSTLRLVSQDLNSEAYANLEDLTPEQGLVELDCMASQAQSLPEIRAEVERGEFERFNQLKSPFHKAEVISGSADMPESRLNWKKLSAAQQTALLNLLIGMPFERLYLSDCTSLTLAQLQALIKHSPELQTLDLSKHPELNDLWLLKLVPEIRNIRTLILREIPKLSHIRNIKSKLAILECLIVSDNPQLQSLSLNTPQLKFLQARNNPRLQYVETFSHELREADLRHNPLLTREGIELRLAHKEGLLTLNRLQLQGSGVIDQALLENYPLLLTQSSKSQSYQEIKEVLIRCLGDGWKTQVSREPRNQLGLVVSLGLRRDQGLPMLLKLVGDGSQWVRQATAEALGTCFAKVETEARAQILSRLLRLVDDVDELVRVTTAQALGACFEKAETETRAQILSALFKLVGHQHSDDEIRNITAEALGACFEKAERDAQAQILSALLKLVDDKEERVSATTAEALGACFKKAERELQAQILSALFKLFDDKEAWVRGTTAKALGACYAKAERQAPAQILSALFELFDDKEAWVRQDAAKALGACFAKAKTRNQAQILSRLLKLVDDKVWWVRQNAAKVLGACFEKADPQILFALFKLVDDESEWVRPATAKALGTCFAKAERDAQTQILSRLFKLLDDKDEFVRSATAKALGACFAKAETETRAQILSRLLKLVGDKEEGVPVAAAKALGTCFEKAESQTQAKKIFQLIRPLSQHKNPEVRKTLSKSFFTWVESSNAIALLPELTELLRRLAEDSVKSVKSHALLVLAKLQTRFNIEDTLLQIMQARQAQKKGQQPYAPPSLLGRRKVLPAIAIDLTLAEPLEHLVRVYEEQKQQLTQAADMALEVLLEQLPSEWQPRVQSLVVAHGKNLGKAEVTLLESMEADSGLSIELRPKLEVFFKQLRAFEKERQAQEAAFWQSCYECCQQQGTNALVGQTLLFQAIEQAAPLALEQQALKNAAQLNAFYVSLGAKLTAIFLAFQVAEHKLGDIDDALQGIVLIDSLVPLSYFKPLVALVCQELSLDKSKAEDGGPISQMMALMSLIEALSRSLAWRYELQIKTLSEVGAGQLAAFAMIRMLEGIKAGQRRQKTLTDTLMAAIVQSRQKQDLPYRQAIARANAEQSFLEADIFFNPGIVVYHANKASFYRGRGSKASQHARVFGYRLGSHAEAEALGLMPFIPGQEQPISLQSSLPEVSEELKVLLKRCPGWKACTPSLALVNQLALVIKLELRQDKGLALLLNQASPKDADIGKAEAGALEASFKSTAPLIRVQILSKLLALASQEHSAYSAIEALTACFQSAELEARTQILSLFFKRILDKDETVRALSIRALGACFKLAPPSARAQILTAFLHQAQDKHGVVCEARLSALGQCYQAAIPSERAQILPELLASPGDEMPNVQRARAAALGNCLDTAKSPERAHMLSVLSKLDANEDWDDWAGRKHRIKSLAVCFKLIKPEERAFCITELLNQVGDEKGWAFKPRAQTAELKSEAPLLLIDAYEHEAVQEVTADALSTCFQIGMPEERAHILSELLKCISNKNSDVRKASLCALQACAKRATSLEHAALLPQFLTLLADEDESLLKHVVLALSACFKTARADMRGQILSELLRFANHTHWTVRRASTEALGLCLTTASSDAQAHIVTQLLRQAGDEVESVRTQVVQVLHALSQAEFEADKLFELLVPWAESQDIRVRRVLSLSLVSWVESSHTLSILSLITNLLCKLAEEPDVFIKSHAEIALARLQLRFNVEDTLAEIASEERSANAMPLQAERLARPFLCQATAAVAQTALPNKAVAKPLLDDAMFVVEANPKAQRGWNCFDVAIGVSREALVAFALAHKKELAFRQLLAPEIRTAAVITAIMMNGRDDAKALQNQEQVLRELFDLLQIAEQFCNKKEIEILTIHIHESLETENNASLPDGLERLALPSVMHSKEVQILVNAYNNAHEAIKPLLAKCNTALGYPEGRRLSFSELSDLFTSADKQAHHAFQMFKEALEQFSPHEKAFHDYCQREDIYEAYINSYYGKEQWLAFIPAAAGKQNTSMVDVAARLVDKTIIIHQIQGRTYPEIYKTSYEGKGVLHVAYNGHNHFEALKPNPLFYFKAVKAELLPKFGLFKTASLETQSALNQKQEPVTDLILGYLA